jgi:hypothetical protein
MPYRRGLSSSATPAAVSDEESFRLVAIRAARTPEGCAGRDWLVYEIAQGTNLITGYRRGDLPSVTAEVEKIVVGLNERRISKKGRQPPPKPTPQAKPAQPSTPSEGSQDADA